MPRLGNPSHAWRQAEPAKAHRNSKLERYDGSRKVAPGHWPGWLFDQRRRELGCAHVIYGFEFCSALDRLVKNDPGRSLVRYRGKFHGKIGDLDIVDLAFAGDERP